MPTRFACHAWLVLPFLASAPLGAAESRLLDAAAASISAAEVRGFVNVLADDTFEGREAGSRGGRAAGLYIVKQMQSHGLTGGGPKEAFYQPFGAGYSNLLGLLKGSDPELKQQYIIISAHYDHVGYGTQRNSYGPIGLIHNGADDNASGVAGLLAIVQAVSQLSEHPKRSILFAFWDGEEKGLLGSKNWVAQPTVPLTQVAVMLNADMIGRARDNRIEVFGSRTAQGFRQLVSLQNEPLPLRVDFSWEIKSNSDHFPFHQQKIPTLFFHTGMHGDYHRPSDDVDRINAEGLQRAAQLMFKTAVALADAPRLPTFRKAVQNENVAEQHEIERGLPVPPGRLGVRWDPKSPHDGGLIIASIDAASAAALGGLKPADRIVAVGGRPVRSAERFRQLVLAAETPLVVAVERKGSDAPLEFTLNLPGRPSRLGIAWRVDDAEPGAVILNRVIPGSPGAMAGLRTNDRIYALDGRSFQSSEEFRQAVTSAAGPLELTVESAGHVRSVIVHPVELEPINLQPVEAGPEQPDDKD